MTLLAPDKFYHFVVSYFLASIDPLLAFFAGIGKEVFDFFGGGTADVFDLLADALGILAAS